MGVPLLYVCRPMARKIQKLVKLSAMEWVILLQLILFSLAAALGLKLVAVPRLIRVIVQCALKPGLRRFPVYQDRCEAGRLTFLVELATRVTHGHGRCLARSLALFWILKARGEMPELLIGVCKEASALNSHAWIETRGIVLHDSREITGRFVTLLRF